MDEVFQIHYELQESMEIYTGVECEVYVKRDRADAECKKLNETTSQKIVYWVVALGVINE